MNDNSTTGGNTGPTLRLVGKSDCVNAPATETHAWKLEPHVCKICFGRMASRLAEQGLVELLCTNCGATSKQERITAACCCSIVLRKRNSSGRSGGQMIDAGIRCIPNPARSSEFPSMYIAQQIVGKAAPRDIPEHPAPGR
ncbi:hypothetical protein [Pseudomonas sp. Q1]|uniref:hypothetical protein n=1 Tax=Pseudomonas sp. Q1 TaxID=2202823 RepID=UPI001374CC36|nr:hypothetical protein [Pseudomonas sp. Q1]